MFSDAFQWHFPAPPTGDYLTVIVDLMRPLSRNGYVKLNSADPLEQPYINLNFFSNDLDLIALREGVRFVDDILKNGEGMKDIIGPDYPWPLPRSSDEAMIRQILERSQTGFRKSYQSSPNAKETWSTAIQTKSKQPGISAGIPYLEISLILETGSMFLAALIKIKSLCEIAPSGLYHLVEWLCATSTTH
jgi:hypothetical protein